MSCSQVLIPLVSIPYISRVLDPDGIGRVSFIDSFTYYFIVIAELGIMVYGIREVAKVKGDPARLRQLVSELLTLHCLSSAITLIFYFAGVYFLWSKINDARLLLFSFSFLLVNFFACEWYFMGQERFRFISLRSLFIRLLGLAAIFLLIHRPDDYHIYYAIISLSAIITGIWNLAVLLRDIPFSFQWHSCGRHLPYVWVTYLISLFYSIPLVLDNVFLGLVAPDAIVGFYAFAAKVVRIAAMVLTGSFLVFLPRIVSLARHNEQDELQRKLVLNIEFIVILALPMTIGLLLVADDIALVFFGEKFAPLAADLRLLALFPLLKGISLFLSNPVLIAHDLEKVFLKNLLFSSLLFIPLSLLAGWYYGDKGMCAALVLTEAILIAGNYLSVRRHLPQLRLFHYRHFRDALLGCLLFIPVKYLLDIISISGSARLVSVIAACLLLYILLLLLLRNNFAYGVARAAAGLVRKYFHKPVDLGDKKS